MWKQLGATLLVAGLSAMTALAQDPTAVPAPGTSVDVQNQVTVIGGSEDSLRAFIVRYLLGNQQNGIVDVIVAGVPDTLPFTLTTPSDAVLYGTVARHGGQAGEGDYYDIAYDTAQTPEQILEFYKQTYTGTDWMLSGENLSQPAAFTGQSSSYSTFCYQNGAATINVNAFNPGTDPTNLNITVQVPGDVYACSSTSQGSPNDPIFALIPSLALPDGVSVVVNTGGGLTYYTPNGPSTYFNAILESNLTLADIATNYNAQLASKNWQQISVENTEHTALSTWTVTDEAGKAWHGTLLIVADVVPNRYNAVIYVQE